MTSKKKKSENAFSIFLEDYVEDERKKGRHVSMRIAAEECGPLWKELSEDVKRRYAQVASVYKKYGKDEKQTKLTNTGLTLAEVEKQQLDEKFKNEQADNEIKNTISKLNRETIKTHLFYIIHCNYYCKTDEGMYVPGEISLAEFSLRDGIRRTYHTLINPGHIPLGFAFDAKKNIEEVHGLPYPPYEVGEADYFGILNRILRFLEPGKLPNGQYPPLYTIENNIKACESILQTLADNSNDLKNFFRVYLLHKMFFWLKNKCVEPIEDENVGFPVLSNAISEIQKDIFCYTPGISCAFHSVSEDKYHNCSLSVVQRMVYIVCDHCCEYVGVELLPQKHCRKDCDVDFGKRMESRDFIESSQRSFISPPPSYSSRPPSVMTESDFDGRSSYCGDMSLMNWRREGPGSFLHEELESKFNDMDGASVISYQNFLGEPSNQSFRGSNHSFRGSVRGGFKSRPRGRSFNQRRPYFFSSKGGRRFGDGSRVSSRGRGMYQDF